MKEYVYSTLDKDTSLNVSSKKTAFDPQIPITLPISLAEMCKHVEGCHSDNQTTFHSQFEVNSRTFHNNRALVSSLSMAQELQDGDITLATIGFTKENKLRNRFKNITTCNNCMHVYSNNRDNKFMSSKLMCVLCR